MKSYKFWNNMAPNKPNITATTPFISMDEIKDLLRLLFLPYTSTIAKTATKPSNSIIEYESNIQIFGSICNNVNLKTKIEQRL